MTEPPQEPPGKAPESKPLTPSGAGELLPATLQEALRKAGLDPADPNTRALELTLMMYSGSLPFIPPPILREYEEIFPGLGARLVEWTETQRAHRQALERTRTDGAERRMNRGQVWAGLVSLVGLPCSCAVGIWGNWFVASVIAIVCVGGPTAAVYLARNTPKPPNPAS
jgi:uncharacterized membrane protein